MILNGENSIKLSLKIVWSRGFHKKAFREGDNFLWKLWLEDFPKKAVWIWVKKSTQQIKKRQNLCGQIMKNVLCEGRKNSSKKKIGFYQSSKSSFEKRGFFEYFFWGYNVLKQVGFLYLRRKLHVCNPDHWPSHNFHWKSIRHNAVLRLTLARRVHGFCDPWCNPFCFGCCHSPFGKWTVKRRKIWSRNGWWRQETTGQGCAS